MFFGHLPFAFNLLFYTGDHLLVTSTFFILKVKTTLFKRVTEEPEETLSLYSSIKCNCTLDRVSEELQS